MKHKSDTIGEKNKMTEQQELQAVLEYLNVTEKQFFEIMEVAYKKVIKKRVEKDNPQPLRKL
jgi:hypothetical protein